MPLIVLEFFGGVILGLHNLHNLGFFWGVILGFHSLQVIVVLWGAPQICTKVLFFKW